MTTASATTPNVFISYARVDGRAYAERLYQDLTAQGIRAWRDERDLNPYQDFTADIENALKSASHVAVCLTENSLVSEGYVRRELNYAILLNKPIIPVRFDDILPPIQIANITWIDAFGRAWDAVLTEIHNRLSRVWGNAEQPAPFEDPFADYLKDLYQQVVDYLDATVFTLIPLRSTSTPGAVNPPQMKTLPALMNRFGGMSLTIKKREATPEPETELHFDHFPDAFKHYGGRVLLLGEPGAGKSTTLMAFARDAISARLSDSTQPLPVIGRIAQWDGEKAPDLATWLGELSGEAWKSSIESAIRNGQALLLLDGLDELGSEREHTQTKERFDPRPKFTNLISSTNQVVISCRVKDYAEIGEKTVLNGAITLTPLSDEQIQGYLTEYPYLWDALQSDNALKEVARTPLLLSIFTYAYAEMGDKAQELRDLAKGSVDLRDKIFATYVERRYEHERLKPNSTLLYGLSELYGKLGEVAVKDVANTNGNVINTYMFDLELFPYLVEEAIELGLISSIGENEVRFIHALLRDYFAGLGARKVLGSKSSLITKTEAIDAIGLLGDVRAIELLLEALEDEDDRVRYSAACALGSLKDKRALQPLLKALGDENENVILGAIKSLGELKHSVAVKPLKLILFGRKHYSWTLKMMAITSLEQIGTFEAMRLVNAWYELH